MGEQCCGLTRRNYLVGSAGAIAASAFPSAALATGQAQAPQLARPDAPGSQTYKCPPCGLPCDQLVFDKPGHCPNCGMTLVRADGNGVTKVGVLLYNGAEIIDFAGPWEVFGTAGYLMHSIAPASEPIDTVFGQKLTPEYTFDNCPPIDILLVPGGAVLQYFDDKRMLEWIRAKAADVHHVMSVCTGAYFLQKAGLLAGQTVTATYGMIEDFAGPDTRVVYDERYVDNGKILTTAGLSAGIDGALHLVSKLNGLGVAQATALAMEYPWEPEGKWARAALADRYLPRQFADARFSADGVKARLLSTQGSRDCWETRLLFTEPGTAAEVIARLGQLIAANDASGGMFKPTPHIKGRPVFSADASNSKLQWRFTDDQGHGWKGVAVVAPDLKATPGLVATVTLAQAH